MHVIATAGHVDHGKSTLVRALTGSDPDRLSEEHRRGLSIELGYCWTTFPEAGEVAFVDVPGHERFISTMLAGVGPVPAMLFVVAADDPWMPQAAEHLAALDALRVRHGVVAVTRCDLADPRPAADRARAEFAITSFGQVAVVPVSGRTGAGIDDLRAALGDLTRALPPPDEAADVRLWVDRRFHIVGVGTVVTGTLQAGCIGVGDRLAWNGHELRVRTIQTLEREVEQVTATARVALGLAGDVPADLGRGSALVTPDAWLAVRSVDVTLAPADAVQLPARPVLHIGATSVSSHCRSLGGRYARLELAHSLPLRIADRILVRDPGSRQVWGATVLDADPPPLRRRGAANDRAALLARLGNPPTLSDEVARRRTVRRSWARRLGYDVEAVDQVTVSAGDWLLDPAAVPALRERLRILVADHDLAQPLDLGLSTADAAKRLDLPTADLMTALLDDTLDLDRGRIRIRARSPGSTSPELPESLLRSLRLLAEELAEQPFIAPSAERLKSLDLDHKAIAAAGKAGRLLRLADGVVLLPGADQSALSQLGELPQPFTVSQARIALGSSRRVVLALLADLDRRGLTRRLPDDRREVTQR